MLNQSSEVYIFPKGRLGLKIAEILGFRINGFIDNFAEGTLRLKDIKNKDSLVIIARVTFMYEIAEQLKS